MRCIPMRFMVPHYCVYRVAFRVLGCAKAALLNKRTLYSMKRAANAQPRSSGMNARGDSNEAIRANDNFRQCRTFLGKARRERSKTLRAKTERSEKLQPSLPSLLSFDARLTTRAESQRNVALRISLTSFDNLHDDVERTTMRSLEMRRQHRRFRFHVRREIH